MGLAPYGRPDPDLAALLGRLCTVEGHRLRYADAETIRAVAAEIRARRPADALEAGWADLARCGQDLFATLMDALVAEARGRELEVEIVGRDEHVRHYVHDRGLRSPAVRWWVGTYEALRDGECVVDDPTLEDLLARVGAKPTPFEDTVKAMIKAHSS